MSERDYRNSVCLVRGNGFGKPDLNRAELGDRVVMVKDVREKPFFFRWTLGWWLIHKEWRIYGRLAGLRGIPEPVARMDRLAFAMEFIRGKPIQRGQALPPGFFSALEKVVRGIHARGVVHLDLRHKGNILVSETGDPYLIDFNSSFCFRQRGLLRRLFFPFLCWVDEGGLLKLKERVYPELMTPEERRLLRRFNRFRRLWIFN